MLTIHTVGIIFCYYFKKGCRVHQVPERNGCENDLFGKYLLWLLIYIIQLRLNRLDFVVNQTLCDGNGDKSTEN